MPHSLVYQTAELTKREGYHISVFTTKRSIWSRKRFVASVTVNDINRVGLLTDPFLEDSLVVLESRIEKFLKDNNATPPQSKPLYELEWSRWSGNFSAKISIEGREYELYASECTRVQHFLLTKLHESFNTI